MYPPGCNWGYSGCDDSHSYALQCDGTRCTCSKDGAPTATFPQGAVCSAPDANRQAWSDCGFPPEAPRPAPCGEPGQPCCDDNASSDQISRCDSFAPSICNQSFSCEACGTVGQPCCAANASSNSFCMPALTLDEANGLYCTTAATCATCGSLGETCCPAYQLGRSLCTDPSTTCSGAHAGTCIPCGGAGQPCCGGACQASDLVCSSGGTCLPCGGDGETCCANSTCAGTAVCGICSFTNTCPDSGVSNTCTPCAGAGASCQSAYCCAGLTCNGSVCN